MSADTKFEKEQYEKREIQLSVKADEYFGDRQPLFMRSVRAEGQTKEGHDIEVAINELGSGIIIRINKRTFVISEYGLVDAALDYMEDAT